MATASREYIMGCALNCPMGWRHFADEIIQSLQKWNTPQRCINWYIRLLADAQDAIDEDVEVTELLTKGNGDFPVVWLNLTFNPDVIDLDALAQLENAFELRIIATASSELSYF